MKKIIKPFLISFLVLILLILGIAATMPKTYKVDESIEIQAAVQTVFPLVADFSKWKEWSPWYDFEPDALYEIKGTPAAVGSSIRWHGSSVGRGTITISDLEEFKFLNMNFQFETPHKSEAKGTFTFEQKHTSTKVTWSNEGLLEYPLGRFFGPVLTGMIGKDLNKGLEKLKARAENSQTNQ
jgi:hypothetical protein